MFLVRLGNSKRDGWSSIDGLEDFMFAFSEWLFYPTRTVDLEETIKIDNKLYEYLVKKFDERATHKYEKTNTKRKENLIINTPFGKLILKST